MRVAILGAGGVGGYFGGVLARSGHSVSVLARGENLAILRQRGLEIRTPEETFLVPVTASDDIRQFDAVDLAIVAVKLTHSRRSFPRPNGWPRTARSSCLCSTAWISPIA